MPFPESIKREARRKAHYMCVVCRQVPFPEVHHIIPEEEEGPDTLDNAAPLCAGCHDIYGNNPDKRKQLRETRDQWYDICQRRYLMPAAQSYYDRIDELYQMQLSMKEERASEQQVLRQVQDSLSKLLIEAGDSVKRAKTFDDVSSTSGYVGTATTLARNVHANFRCRNCGTTVGLLIGTDKCPTCGTPIT